MPPKALANIDAFVAPDAGAAKEVQQLAILMNKEFIQGHKTRDTRTGALSGFGYSGSVEGKNLLIIDDICDGGGTFIGLAEALRATETPEDISLYVTHGMFTKGYDGLLKCFSTIYTTNTYISDIYKNMNSIF